MLNDDAYDMRPVSRMFVTDDFTAIFMPIVRRRSFIPTVKPSRAIIASQHQRALNVSTRKVGGLRFIKVGRLCLSFCITSTYRPL